MTGPGETAEAAGRARVRALLVCVGLALGPAVVLGLARFAYSLLLPAMRADLSWSYAQAGTMNTANALGYLAGALLADPLGRRMGTRRMFASGMALATAALFAAGLTSDFALQLILRLVAGLAAAGTFIGGAALVAKLGDRAPGRAGMLLTIYTAGAGLGILASGLVVPPVLAATDAGGWRWAWFVLAALALVSLLIAWPSIRQVAEPDPPPGTRGRPGAGWIGSLWLPGIGYLLFGGGYIAYVTFIIAYLEHEGFSPSEVTAFWAVLGIAALAGVVVWGWILDHLRSGHALAAMNGTLLIGSVLPLLVGGVGPGIASAVIFGSTFLAIPAGMAHLARRRLPPATWAGAIAGLTVAFAIGQSIGPALAGVLADLRGGAGLGLILAAIALAAAALTYLGSERRARP